jgi:hypothetical protein
MVNLGTRRLDLMDDTVVEILDPATRRLIATTRIPGYVMGFVDDTRLLAIETTDEGFVRGVIHRVRFTMP